jgi:UDP:flavonoid glycosyltransferase YjiC (YdhE family)
MAAMMQHAAERRREYTPRAHVSSTMRVLFTTTGGAGHVGPLLPFARALHRDGHDILVAVRRSTVATVVAAGLPVWEVDDAPAEPRAAAFAPALGLETDAANALVVGEIFAGFDAPAALPGIEAAIERWQPDLLVHEMCEFAGPVAAERAGVPCARVGIGLEWTADRFLRSAAPAVDRMRTSVGLAPDPDFRRWTDTPAFSLAPAGLEDPSVPGPGHVRRYRDDEEPAATLPDWWPGQDGPLVYVTFGSVAPAMPFFPGVFRGALDALADLPVRVLMTIGRVRDPAELGPLPANAHVEGWVRQADVEPHAAAIVCHGGFGTVRAGLAAGVPLVVVPLFADQPYNGRRVAALGAGETLGGGPAAVAGLRRAVERVLDDATYAAAAARIAAENRALPPAEQAVEELRTLAASRALAA